MPNETPPLETVAFEVATAEGSFVAQVTIPTGQTNLSQMLPILQTLDNALVEGATAQLGKEGKSVSCKAGCGACCRQMVPISIFEAEMLVNWMRTLPVEQLEKLSERFHQGLLTMQAAGVLDLFEKVDASTVNNSAREFALAYLKQQIPCPFLEEESCSIHPIRPLVCREYLVSSPAEHCSYPSDYKPEAVNLQLRLARVLNRTAADWDESGRGWIPLLFLPAWLQSGSQPGKQIVGSGREVLGVVFQHIETVLKAEAAEDEER